MTGLFAAYRALQRGHKVTLFEPGSIGGLVRSQALAGFTLEQGPNVFLEKPCLAALLQELELTSHRRYPLSTHYRQMVWYQGKAQVVPKSPRALLQSPFFGWADKLLLLPRMLWPGMLKPEQEDLSIGSFLQPLVGASAVQHLVNPAFKGIFGGDIFKLSARSVFPEWWKVAVAGGSALQYMKTKKKAPVFVLEGGLQTLVDALWRRIRSGVELRKEALVELHYNSDPQFVLRGQTTSLEAQRVLVCTSGPSSAGFVAGVDPELARNLDALSYASIIVVHLSAPSTLVGAVPGGIPENCFGVLFPDQAAPLLGVMFNTQLFPHLAPAGKQLLTVCLGGTQSAALCVEPDASLYALAQQQLLEKLGIGQLEPLAVRRWPRAIPQLVLGHHHLDQQLAACEARFPGLEFLGVDRGGVGVPDRLQYVETHLGLGPPVAARRAA